MNHRRDRFGQLPPEIIQHIAVAACEATVEGPPSELARLLQVSRTLHAALCVEHNPGVHARVFSAKFDSGALIRRFAAVGRPLTARNFAHELQRRWISLKRIRALTNAEQPFGWSEDHSLEDFWMIFLMLTESDGRNLAQMHWARVTKYVRTVIRDVLYPPTGPGYLIESTPRALGLWLMWYFTNLDFVIAEQPTDAASMRGMLRTWALASHKYGTLFAPYTHWTLPTPNEPNFVEVPFNETPHCLADLDLRNRTEVVTYMGRRIRLATPQAAVAAIMAFMVRIERNGPIPPRPTPPIPPTPGQPATESNHPGLRVYPRTRYPHFDGPGKPEFDGRENRTGSAAYDTEWYRLLQCGNPHAKLNFKPQSLFTPGDLAGSWEGRSVVSSVTIFASPRLANSLDTQRIPINQHLNWDAFREMLAGVPGVVANGMIAQQPQVWHFREHHLVSRRRRIPLGRESDLVVGEELPTGRPLDAFIPNSAEFIYHDQPNEYSSRHLEVRVPDSTSSLGYKSYNYITLDDPVNPSVQNPTDSVSSTSLPPTDSMDLSPDWDAPRPRSLGDGDDEFDEEIIDTLITGESQTAWGTFKLRGRIRAWDGMITILRNYDVPLAAGNGRWLYTGYITPGGNWVGRWRDTFSAEWLSGYEGPFSAARMF